MLSSEAKIALFLEATRRNLESLDLDYTETSIAKDMINQTMGKVLMAKMISSMPDKIVKDMLGL